MSAQELYEINAEGVMTVDGHDVRQLLETYGSPLIVYKENLLRENCRAYKKQLSQFPHSRVYYASKSFLTTGFCKLLEQEGMCLDVVSSGELYTAIQANFPPERILMHGNAKSQEDLEVALDYNVGRIVIDNLSEIDRLATMASSKNKQVQVMIRVSPGVKPSTHAYIQTGQIDSKFGFNLAGGAAEEAVRLIQQKPSLLLVGLHCHIGSQIFEVEPYEKAAQIMMEFYHHLQKDLGVPLTELNLGGGLGIQYTREDRAPNISDHLERYKKVVVQESKRLGIEVPILCDEPGRSIAGRAGITLYTVESTKKIPDVRNYVSVDGGMTDNPRFALYNAKYEVLVANKMNQTADQTWSVSGKCCETGDMLQKDVLLPEPEVGDIIAMLSTGSYTYSMASNYNRVARPAVILVNPQQVGLLARRETMEDLVRLDCVPAWLK